MKIAYLILAHNEPEQIIRLVERLREADTCFVIHFDRRGKDTDFTKLKDRYLVDRQVRLAERIACYWGGFSLVQAALSCIETLFEEGLAFEYAMLLSGQDYPIKRNEEIAAFLTKHQGQEFLAPWPLPHADWGKMGGFDRLHFYHWNDYPVDSFVRKMLFFCTRVMRKLNLARRLPPDLQFYGGSQWWCLSWQTLQSLRQVIQSQPQLIAFFRHTNIPDEMFFQTLLMNYAVKPEQLYPESIRYIVWHVTATNEHPKEMDASDLASMLRSDKLFARKFNTSREPHLLDTIDELVHHAAPPASISS